MKIAFVVFNGITWLDMVGFYDPITRLKSMKYLPELSLDLCSFTETVIDTFGLEVRPHKVKTSLAGYDVLFVPGGWGTRQLQYQQDFMEWIQTAEQLSLKVSVCTGSLLLGAAGFLKDRKATTNFQEYETLKKYCREVVPDRIVEDGNIITAGAVSSSIDLGLYLCEKWAGAKATEEIRKRMDYRGW